MKKVSFVFLLIVIGISLLSYKQPITKDSLQTIVGIELKEFHFASIDPAYYGDQVIATFVVENADYVYYCTSPMGLFTHISCDFLYSR